MAASALAFDYDALPEPVLVQDNIHALRPTAAPAAAPAADVQAYHEWHRQQFERIAASFGEPVKAPTHVRLPLQTRAAIVIGGALIGWAVPIALATALIR
jgi:hypothetical protein